MADENISILGIDIGDSEAVGRRLSATFDAISDAQKRIIQGSGSFKKTGETTRGQIISMDEAGNKLIQTFGRLRDDKGKLTGAFGEIGRSIELAKQKLVDFQKLAATSGLSQVRASANSKDIQDSQKRAALEAAGAGANAAFGSKLGLASDKQILEYNRNLGAALKLLEQGKVSVEDFNKVLTNISAGKITTELNPGVARLQELLVKVNNTFKETQSSIDATAAKAKKAADQAAADAKKQAAEIRKQEAEAKKIRDQSAAVNAQGNANAAFAKQIPLATPAQLTAFNAAMGQATALIAKGKVSLQDFNTILQNVRVGKISTELNPALTQLQGHLQAAQNSFKNLGQAGENAGKSVFLSWSNVVRIFEAQILFSIFNKIQSGFADATQSAADYSKQVALIQTISQDAGVSTSQWADGIRRVSDQLGLPIADTAAAGYEALSNQVAKGADAFRFLGTAGDFARTTGSSLVDSVDLISSAMNSFELDASQAERIAKSFFTTIDLGRVKTPELANSFGRSGVLAHQLGISLEELNASISTLTRQGIKPNEAYTLLNNVFQKLIKPTEALEGFFKRIGVANGEQAIQTYGYIGVLELLKKAFNGSASEAAKYFDEIRGGRGARNLTESLGDVKSDLAQNLSSSTNYDNAKDIVKKSFGQQFTEETNKIKNFFVADVGGTFLKTILSLTNVFGGLSKSIQGTIQIMKIMVEVGLLIYSVGKVTAFLRALTAVKAAYNAVYISEQLVAVGMIRIGQTATAAWAAATLGASIFFAAVAAGALYLTDFGNGQATAIRELNDSLQQAADDRIRVAGAADDVVYKHFEQSLTESKQAFLKYSAEIRLEYGKIIDNFAEQSEKIGDAIKAQMDLITSLMRKSLAEGEKDLKKTASQIDFLKKEIKETPREYNRKIFEKNADINERNVKNGGVDKAQGLYQAYIDSLLKIAKIQIYDEDNLEEGHRTLQEAAKVADKLSGLERKYKTFKLDLKGFNELTGEGAKLKKTGQFTVAPNVRAGEDAGLKIEKLILTILNDQLAVKEKLKKVQEQDGNKQLSIFERYQEAQKDLLKFKILDDKGQVKEKFRGPDGEALAEKEQSGLQDRVKALLKEFNAGIGDEIHTAEEFAKQRAKLGEDFAAQKANTKGELGARNALDIAEAYNTSIIKNTEALLALTGSLKGQKEENLRLQLDQKNQILSDLAVLKNATGNGVLDYLNPVGTIMNGKADAQIQIERAQEIAKKPNLTGKDISELRAAFFNLRTAIDKFDASTSNNNRFLNSPGQASTDGGITNPAIKDSVSNIGRNVELLAPTRQAGVEIADALKSAIEKGETLKALAATLSREALPGIGTGAQQGATAAVAALGQIQRQLFDVQRAASDTATAIAGLTQLKVEAAKQAAEGAPGPGKSRGGMIGYYAGGGFLGDFMNGKFAKGTDTIPTMLTKGEYVVDAANTKKFLPILRSMSAGKFGQRDGGGNSTTNVGDINITVQGGSTSPQTIKEIGIGLRRAVRQNTIKLSR